ncbi:MAG: right-handed parallel beta-helix repeat-containing protein, partial [candidate division Zixibacteria bacterium]|nr:right-handed parallel beta-helix repeat-containing protein [candidate division Zixibacteria bacterium]
MMKWTTIVIVVCLSAQPCLGAVINVPVDQPTIQAAIDSASFGDSIYVSSGTYLEAIVIDESVILKGESKETTVIDGGWAQYVVLITVDSVTFTGFTVKHGSTGLYIATGNNTISDNIITDVSGSGIYGGGDQNIHVGNTISGCSRGIGFGSGSGNIVYQNTCSANGVGIDVRGRTYDEISRNELSGNNIGLIIELLSERCVISANNIHNNGIGIKLSQDVDRSEFKRNVIRDNSSYGIYVDLYGGWRSDSNFFYHNIFVNNPVNAYDECINVWDKEYPTGGNYWHDYTGVDDDGDGIGDTPHD